MRSKIATFTKEPAESFGSSWIKFKSYQRDCPPHGFDEVQLLNTYYRGIAVQYQIALGASRNGNFNTKSPEEAVKVIENLASSTNTKYTDFERKRSAVILGNDQMDEVKAKLDSVHKLLRRQVCLVEDAEAVDTEGRAEVEDDVNFISGTRFQGSGVRSTRNPTATTTTATLGAMKTPTTRSRHHHLLKRTRLKRCLIGFLRDISV